MSLVEGLAHDYIGEDREMRELVPQRLLTFRESVAVTLEAEKNHQTPHAGSRVHRLPRLEPTLLVLRQEILRRTRTAPPRALFKVLQQFVAMVISSRIVRCGGCAARSTG